MQAYIAEMFGLNVSAVASRGRCGCVKMAWDQRLTGMRRTGIVVHKQAIERLKEGSRRRWTGP